MQNKERCRNAWNNLNKVVSDICWKKKKKKVQCFVFIRNGDTDIMCLLKLYTQEHTASLLWHCSPKCIIWYTAEKAPHNTHLWDSLPSNWPVLLKNVRLNETRESWQLNECCWTAPTKNSTGTCKVCEWDPRQYMCVVVRCRSSFPDHERCSVALEESVLVF